MPISRNIIGILFYVAKDMIGIFKWRGEYRRKHVVCSVFQVPMEVVRKLRQLTTTPVF
jgi:hypothetical protein